MTEDEAKAKWCPFFQFHPDGPKELRSAGVRVAHAPCVASACMAWRERYIRPVVKGVVEQLPYGMAIATAQTYPETVVDGYCGLVGPE